MPFENLIGKRFGNLVILDIYDIVDGKRRRALCKCDCGKEKSIILNDITRKTNPVKSCGCLRTLANKNRAIDLTGVRHERLMPIYRFYKHNKIYWHCKCDCGNEVDVLST
nr:MAG TPA: hypothetical protein [Caudoviricetes sp.]